MGVPLFLLRKLYRRGSLVQVGDGRFRLTLQNPLADATLVAPPRMVINGVTYDASDVQAPVDLAAIDATAPFVFPKGASMDLVFPGVLLRGANRVHIEVQSQEFGELEIFVEDKVPDLCPLPDEEE